MFKFSLLRAPRARRGATAGLALAALTSLTACEAMTLRSEQVGTTSNARVGASIDISEDGLTMAVGEPRGRARAITDAGVVTIYTRSSTGATWAKQATLYPEAIDRDSLFGADVALSDDGSQLVVGAPEYLDKGAVFAFSRSDETWSVGQRLLLGGRNLDNAGSSVAVSGDGSVIAAGIQRKEVAKNNIPYKAAGQVWLFEKTAIGWGPRYFVLNPSLPQENGFFGWSVALSKNGDDLFVGMPGYDQYSDSLKTTVADVGRVEYFKRGAALTWDFKFYLDPGTGVIGEAGYFGRALAMSGDDQTVIVGAPGEDDVKPNVGGLAVFNRKNNGWEKLTFAPGMFENGAAGTSLDISTDASHILLGIPGYSNGVGAISLLEKKNGSYVLIEGYGTGVESGFGTSVALSGDEKVWAAGMPGFQDNKGGFRTFDAFNAPGAPTAPSATAGDAAAAVSWTPPLDNGGLALIYTVTSSPDGKTCTVYGTSCIVSGLTNGTAYTFTVTAKSDAGVGAASLATAAATPVAGSRALLGLGTVPGEVRDVKVVAGWKRATVSWSAPISNGGQEIQTYEVTATPGGKKCVTIGETSCVFTGLAAKRSYKFSVVAVNVVGAGNAVVTEKFGLQPKVSLRGGPTKQRLAIWQGLSIVTEDLTSLRLRGKASRANCKIVDGRLFAKVAGTQCKVTLKVYAEKTLTRTLVIQTVRR